jgi:hypothetical protein
MSLEQLDRLDIVHEEEIDGGRGLVLMALDGGSVTDPQQRFGLMIKKLAVYTRYVASAAFKAEHPGILRHRVRIRVFCATPPTPEMLRVDALRPSETSTLRIPVEVSYRPLTPGPHGPRVDMGDPYPPRPADPPRTDD